MITDRLIEGIIDMQNPTCVGLDTLFDYLPDEMKAGAKSFDDEAFLSHRQMLMENFADERKEVTLVL